MNIPPLLPDEQPTGVKVCPPVRAAVGRHVRGTQGPARPAVLLEQQRLHADTEQDTDVAALRDGYITVTPLQFDLTQYPMLREWESREWKVGMDS